MNDLLVHPRYEALAVVGRGSQGVVLRVRDRENPAAPLVAKVWDGPEHADRGEGALRDELAVLARLVLPGIARVRDLARDTRDGRLFLVEDLIDDPTAAEFVAAAPRGPARAGRLARVLGEAVAILAALHDHGVTHGDLKPAHLCMGERGLTMLDLGSARAPALGVVGGGFSPAFAAPEIVAGGPATPAADLYALGASVLALADVRVGEDVRAKAPYLAPSIVKLLSEMVATDPSERPASALAVLARLVPRHRGSDRNQAAA